MHFDLSDKTAPVTGASGGLGRATARSLAREGVRLAITARREAALRGLATEIEADGLPAVTVNPGRHHRPGRPRPDRRHRRAWTGPG